MAGVSKLGRRKGGLGGAVKGVDGKFYRDLQAAGKTSAFIQSEMGSHQKTLSKK